MANKKRYVIKVRGYIPQAVEVSVRVRSRNPENAKLMALDSLRGGELDNEQHVSYSLSEVLWDKADIDVG